jgi:cytochrome P450
MMPQELLAESMQLLAAGHETSSTVLGWTLYLLGRHHEALQRLRDECEAVLGDRPLVTSDIERLPFTTAVLKETMRLYPAFWMIDRLACADGEADGVPMPAGTRLALFVHGVHRSPAWWQAPEGFEPDRFFGPERANERACAYLPFGAGPRVCIGSAYAMLQMLMVLAAFVRRYDFALTVDRVIEPRPLLILRAGDRIFLRVQRRKPSG